MRHAIDAARPEPTGRAGHSCRTGGAFALALALTIAAGTAGLAHGDDTEIFFGQVRPGAESNPNVLFVLDTSGSMTNTDGTGSTRLQRMKDALNEILDSSSNVNVGIMRFQGRDGGASVLYPVTPLEREICPDGGCGDIATSSRVESGGDDVEERLSDGRVWTGGNILSLPRNQQGELQLVGLRFPDVVVPQGARITSATLELVAHASSGGMTELELVAEASDDAAPFGGDARALSDRLPLTGGEPTTWAPGPWNAGERYTSVDLAATVQAVVDRPGWCGGNALALLLAGAGERHARSFEQSSTDAARLRISYDPDSIPASGGCASRDVVVAVKNGADDVEERLHDNGSIYTDSSDLELPLDGGLQLVGLRFRDVAIPRGAQIEQASVEFEIDEEKSGSVNLAVRAELAADAAPFAARRRDVSGRSRTSPVAWNDVPALAKNERLVTPDLAAIVQRVVDLPGWEPDNALVLTVENAGSGGRRTVESFDGEPGAAAKLRVRYRVPSGAAASARPALETARDEMKRVVDGIGHAGGTPIVDAFYEATQYMRGGAVDYGRQRGVSTRVVQNRVSHGGSWSGGTVVREPACTDEDIENGACLSERISGSPVYDSPMDSSCQSNHIVLLTDGEATSNSSAAKVRDLIGRTCEAQSNSRENCGRELAAWLFDTDHRGDIVQPQNITSHMIGLELEGRPGMSFLEAMARSGGGRAYTASRSTELVDAFESIIGEALAVDTSFVAPGATVNQFNRLTHRSDIYFALYKPSTRPTWKGNLKRYEVARGADGDLAILDVDGDPAVDPSTGFFARNARSWWSDAVDGNDVGLGGAAGELVATELPGGQRRVFTFTGDDALLTGDGVDLTETAHALHEDNEAITLEMLGLDERPGTDAERATERARLLAWGRGLDVDDEDEDGDSAELRPHLGDPMHSRPVILNYARASMAGEDDVDTSVYVATNEGFLHAIDRDSGRELYGFMPKELLGNLAVFHANEASVRHPYGLDGSLSVWTDDRNNNVMIDPGETAYLYVGMRRGGNNYYAIDVSDQLAPRLAWVIRGGADGMADFAELGQTWSRPVPTRMMIDSVERDVLVFGAGYDTNQDPDPHAAVDRRSVDAVGRGFFVVDARTGELLFRAGREVGSDVDLPLWRLDYSVPGDIRVIDVDFDGLADQLWFADTGGQLWRIDIAPYHDGSVPLMQGDVVAELSGAGPANERRFYYEPDVSLVASGGERYLAVSIGSGWRAHPLDTDVEDRFYMIRSDAVFEAPPGYGRPNESGSGYRPITEADLVDVTDTLEPGPVAHGWYVRLTEPGEKVLAGSITVNNQVIFTTYRPEATAGVCSTALGTGAVYVVDVRDGSPTVDGDGPGGPDGELGVDDRATLLAHGGIPPEPAALITADGPTVLVGPEQPVEVDFDNLTRRSYWVDNGRTRPDAELVAETDEQR